MLFRKLGIIAKDELPGNIKESVFIYCIDKYETKYSEDKSNLKNTLKIMYRERNALAHWPVDTDPDALIEYAKTKRINFIKIQKAEIIDNLFMGESSSIELIEKIINARNEVSEMINKISGLNKDGTQPINNIT